MAFIIKTITNCKNQQKMSAMYRISKGHPYHKIPVFHMRTGLLEHPNFQDNSIQDSHLPQGHFQEQTFPEICHKLHLQ